MKLQGLKHSGFCSVCGKKLSSKFYRHNRTGQCKECYTPKGIKKLSLSNSFGKPLDIQVKCHMPNCGKFFNLQEGQHSSMAWCPECRQRDEYINFTTYRQDRYPLAEIESQGSEQEEM